MTEADPRRGERRYWRSMERLADSPALAEEGRLPEHLRPEFADGADRPPDGVTRRTVLGLMGASMALAGATACRRPEETIVPYVQAPERVIPGLPRYYASAVPLGAEVAGVVVESHEGRPTKIEGNPRHPSSGGGASAWSQAAILHLYDPDRLREPMRRDEGGNLAAAPWADFDAAWSEAAARLEEDGGAGLAVVSGEHASPTLARLAEELRARFPQMRWVVHEPAGAGNAYAGLDLATGRRLRPVYHLERARVILSLDADLLHTEPEAVRHARGFAAGRRPDGDDGSPMNRLYVVEPTPTVTGGSADHRVRLAAGRVGTFAAAVAAELGVGSPAVKEDELDLEPAVREQAAAVARDLAAAGSAALVAAGRRQPPAVHALAHALNDRLGAVGTTVTLADPPYAADDGGTGLAELTEAAAAGRIDTLVILSTNPVYSSPGDVDVAAALDAVPNVVYLAHGGDETAAHAGWVLPEASWLESWGDGRSADGTEAVIQPLIAPLFGGRSAVELVAQMARGGDAPSGYDLVRETWAGRLGGDFEAAWRRALHDGVLPAAAADAGEATTDAADDAAVAAAAMPAAAAPAIQPQGLAAALSGAAFGVPAADGLELTLALAAGVHDGRFANVAWLQEVPDPVTKLTWDNAALLSPRTAAEHGFEDGDLVRLAVDGDGVEVPVVVVPGQADGSVTLTLGYGRRAAGRVGDGVGADAYALRTRSAAWIRPGAGAEATGDRAQLAHTQEHGSMEGRHLVRGATLAEYREDPRFVEHEEVEAEAVHLWEKPPLDGPYQWGMAIDLASCTGCNACIVACQSENNIPSVGRRQVRHGRELLWLRVDRYFEGDADDPAMVFQPVPCMHCENAPCEQVCPVAATVHDAEGINAMVYNRCIGTRYCSNNCPYKVRRFNYFNFAKNAPVITQMARNPDVTVRSRGVMEKCTYCLQRINEAKARAQREGRRVTDGEVRTACQQTCPSDAISFGDLTDPESAVSKAKRSPRNYVMLGELQNLPRTSYLARVTNPNPQWPGGAAAGGDEGRHEEAHG